ncbi:MAG: tRNA pseudouridine(55) synthase TruB [Solirubrobacterales bacterium]|nr:tRNA pseudouridine(55) synthase TruB [Solirubrobacterales bacterium]HMT04942.1 tRNA pseudouridine(55) synthase TruB [Solirubrobacterales bacterium]
MAALAPEPETGILLVDKPAGMTSHDVVARIRRERGGKVGHAGTLDPFATGLLTILLGRATRLQRYLLDLPKTYLATARLGWVSTTGDPDGELTRTGNLPEKLELPTGRIRQMVPMTSAVKVNGERLYKRAHRGEQSEDRPVREVEIYRAGPVDLPSGPLEVGQEVRFEVEVSSGTYVRTLVEELDDAYCSALRRTAVGPLELGQAERILTPREALSFMPAVELNTQQVRAVGHGQKLPAEELDLPADVQPGAPGSFNLVHGDNLIAVARLEDQTVRSEVVMEIPS